MSIFELLHQISDFPNIVIIFYDNAVLQSEAHPRPIHVHLEMLYTISLQNIVTINFVTFLKQCNSKSFPSTQLYCITCSYFFFSLIFWTYAQNSMSLFTAYNAIIDQWNLHLLLISCLAKLPFVHFLFFCYINFLLKAQK